MRGEHRVESSGPRYLTSHDVARLLGVSASALNRWIDHGYLPAFRPRAGTGVESGALVRFLREPDAVICSLPAASIWARIRGEFHLQPCFVQPFAQHNPVPKPHRLDPMQATG
jgi:hypothetical protein